MMGDPPSTPRPRGPALLWQELRARASLYFAKNSPWRDPSLYADPLNGDDYWILAGRWGSDGLHVHPARVHPTLGWVQGHLLPANPRGLHDRTRERLVRDGRPKVLFYGDSFVEGAVDPECWLPRLLEEQLDGAADVVHLGVGGYGTDQMHLLLKETIREVDGPCVVLMGVMDFSFDRACQSVRSYQKPRLTVGAGGRVESMGAPIEPNPERFYRRRRTSFRSYALQAWRHSQSTDCRYSVGLEDKARVNRAIIDANAEVAKEEGAELGYVLFHDWFQLATPGLRGEFFTEALAARRVPTLETRETLRASIEEAGTDGAELYRDGHHTEAGNRLIASALVDFVKPLLAAARDRRPFFTA